MIQKSIDAGLLSAFRDGMVIPAMPLALDEKRSLDERRQRALARYYVDAGAGGLAVGVHSTQFEIRDEKHGLYQPVLSLVSEALNDWGKRRGRKLLKVAGICGGTQQALAEAALAKSLGYHAGLLSLSALKEAGVDELIRHATLVSEVFPVIGFYLQPSVGGRVLPFSFWRRFAELPGVIGIKMAPFNRYQTFDVVRAVAEAGAEDRITLYTGNDDNIVVDLLTQWNLRVGGRQVRLRVKGGLLGHWCVWTRRAVELLSEIKAAREQSVLPAEWLTRAAEITDSNAVLFDAANGFAGCIPGIHEVLRRQGLLSTILCLNPHETLSRGQAEELDRIQASYPMLHDDVFVKQHLAQWLGD
ncbi:MAG: dihydrodipicolinate synthase family protein [Spirochaetes bacterium]|nr:dihydrodipicolinate synthase family protein [Spirochaetota bacterium]